MTTNSHIRMFDLKQMNITSSKLLIHKFITDDGYRCTRERMHDSLAMKMAVSGVRGMHRHRRVTKHGLHPCCCDYYFLI